MLYKLEAQPSWKQGTGLILEAPLEFSLESPIWVRRYSKDAVVSVHSDPTCILGRLLAHSLGFT